MDAILLDEDIKIECRSCSKNCIGEGLDMTDSSTGTSEATLLEMFKHCTRLFLDDSFPKYLCHLCSLRLKDAYQFIKQCQEANQRFVQVETVPKLIVEEIAPIDDKSWITSEPAASPSGADWAEPADDNHDDDNYEEEKYKIPMLDCDETPVVRPMPKVPTKVSYQTSKNKYVGYLCPSPSCRQYCGHKPRHLQEHLKKHEGELEHKFICYECNTPFNRRVHLFSHSLQMHKEHTCDLCSTIVRGERALVRHKKKEHKISLLPPAICSVCGKCLSNKKVLMRHMISRHNIGGEVKLINCKQCDRTFKTAIGLVYHERSAHTGERPFCCDVCGKSFVQLANLQFHKYTHSDAKNYECDICSVKVKTSWSLKEHRQLHFLSNDFKCNLCDQSFKLERYLKAHVDNVHAATKDIVCQVCGSKYQSQRNLRAHMKKHGEPQHKCHLCGKSYIRKPELTEHINSEHEQKRLWACEYANCGKSYLRKCHMQHHVKTAHLGQHRSKKNESPLQ